MSRNAPGLRPVARAGESYISCTAQLKLMHMRRVRAEATFLRPPSTDDPAAELEAEDRGVRASRSYALPAAADDPPGVLSPCPVGSMCSSCVVRKRRSDSACSNETISRSPNPGAPCARSPCDQTAATCSGGRSSSTRSWSTSTGTTTAADEDRGEQAHTDSCVFSVLTCL